MRTFATSCGVHQKDYCFKDESRRGHKVMEDICFTGEVVRESIHETRNLLTNPKQTLRLCAFEGCCAKEYKKSGWCRQHSNTCDCGKRIGHLSKHCAKCHGEIVVKVAHTNKVVKVFQKDKERRKEIRSLIAHYVVAKKHKRIVSKEYADLRIAALKAML